MLSIVMRTIVMRTMFGLILGLIALPVPGHAQAVSLRLMAGDAGEQSLVLAAEMAELFAAGPSLRVLPRPGDAGHNNLARLLTEPGIDIAFVSTDALVDGSARDFGDLQARLELAARLAPEEIHVVARHDIARLEDLAGHKVNFGPAGGSAAVTGERLFKMLNIQVEPQALDLQAALAQLQRGAIDAAVIVGGKPVPIVGEIRAGLGIHLLPIPFLAAVEETYLPARFDHDDYPNLIETETSVPSLATGMALLAARGKDDPGGPDRVALFIETLFSRFTELERPNRPCQVARDQSCRDPARLYEGACRRRMARGTPRYGRSCRRKQEPCGHNRGERRGGGALADERGSEGGPVQGIRRMAAR